MPYTAEGVFYWKSLVSFREEMTEYATTDIIILTFPFSPNSRAHTDYTRKEVKIHLKNSSKEV